MKYIEAAEEFEHQVTTGGEWLGSAFLAQSTVAQCNQYIQNAGWTPLPDTITPQVMVLGVVKEAMFGRPLPLPMMVKATHDPLVGSNHETSFRGLYEKYGAKPFRTHSFWLGFVLRDGDLTARSYHLILNTYGDLDGLRAAQRRTVASKLTGMLENVHVCTVIESPDSAFDGRTGRLVAAYEKGIDFSIPW